MCSAAPVVAGMKGTPERMKIWPYARDPAHAGHMRRRVAPISAPPSADSTNCWQVGHAAQLVRHRSVLSGRH